MNSDFFACPDCDLLVRRIQEQPGFSLYCPRCGRLLRKNIPRSVEKALALSFAGILLFFPALLMPLINFEMFGFADSGNLLDSILHLFACKFYFVAIVVALFTAIFPFILLSLVFATAVLLYFHIRSRWAALFFRTYLHIREWAMLEIYLLGILVAIIKMVAIAKVSYPPGLFCFAAISILIIILSSVIDRVHFWEKIEELLPQQPEKSSSVRITLPAEEAGQEISASSRQLLRCHGCDKLLGHDSAGGRCPRCQSPLHMRNPDSRKRSLALLLASTMLLLPANILPIMDVHLLSNSKSSTIIDGIIYFFKSGSYLVGAVIFIASVAVPFFKIIGLYLLLSNRQKQTRIALQKQTRLYRFIIFIGRWSMLDIFVVALLASSVDFGFLSSTWIAPGARWFCLVVIVTMLVSINFDPRLMWDSAQKTVYKS